MADELEEYFELNITTDGGGNIVFIYGNVYNTDLEEFGWVLLAGDWLEDFDPDLNRKRWTDRNTGRSIYVKED